VNPQPAAGIQSFCTANSNPASRITPTTQPISCSLCY